MMDKVALHAPAGSVGDKLAAPILGWNRFWFQPADPTTLGFIRILAGLFALYTHLAYSWDLHQFFGADAWMTVATANHQRLDAPRPPNATGWYGLEPTAPPLPPDVERRDKVLDELATFPDLAAADQSRILSYLKMPIPPDNADWGPWTSLSAYLVAMPPDDSKFAPRNRALVAQFVEGLPKAKAERADVITYIKEWNIDPRQVNRGSVRWSLWFHLTQPGWMVFAHCIVVVIFVLFTIGFCTRITSVLAWLAALSYVQRAPNVLFGGDTMMVILLLYLMIGPSGAALSVDRWLAHWWAARNARRLGLPESEWAAPQPMVSANFALRLIQVHFCIIYFSAGTSKLMGASWWNGQAIYYTMANYEFSPLRYGYFHGFLQWLSGHRLLWEIFMGTGTFGTLILELTLPLLIWNRKLRMPFVLWSMMLHISIAIFMGLVVFSLLMATMVFSFVPGETTRWMLNGVLVLLRRKPLPAPAAPVEEPPVESEASHEEEAHATVTAVKTKRGRK